MKNIYYASDYAVLDSHVEKGGGTDDTAALQSILDKARDGRTPVRLVMDGAALITGLVIWPNTTIECINPSCGFFLADGSNCPLLKNEFFDKWFDHEPANRNITISGGTWNHNARGQAHDVPIPPEREYPRQDPSEPTPWWVMAFMFCGVENFGMKDVTIRNQRTFAMAMKNWRFVNIDNVNIILDEYMPANNQDGLHFLGPGQFLSLKNITGTAGDDIIALGPDEIEGECSISDVMIDGLHMNHSDQGIRMLCGRKGTLDRVLIKNVTGTYRGYGFIMNPWFDSESGGCYKNIIIDTVDIRADDQCYDYMPPFIFRLGGNMEHITFRNVHYHGSLPQYIAEIGGMGFRHEPPNALNRTRIRDLVLENVYIYDDPADHSYICCQDRVDALTLRNWRVNNKGSRGCLLELTDTASVGELRMESIITRGLKTLTDRPDRIQNIHKRGIITL